jgi:hypothetical protein
MMMDKFTDMARAAVAEASESAVIAGHAEVTA